MKLFLLAGMCFCLNGCALTMEIVAISGISYLATGKSLSDNAFSLATNQDCALHRMILGEPLCEKQAEALISQTETPNPETNATAVQAFDLQPWLDKEVSLTLSTEMSTVALSTRDFSIPMDENEQRSNEYQLAEKFVVVGSFNSYKYAQHRNQEYLHFNAHIIENPSSYPTKYRVVVGPINRDTLSAELPVMVGAETQLPWEIDLCINDMSPPPCDSEGHQNTFAVNLNPTAS
jgi:hypothetical protein